MPKATNKPKRSIMQRALDKLPCPVPDNRIQFEGGAVRCNGVAGDVPDCFPLRFDLIRTNDAAIRRLARTYGEGSLKYGDANWKNGIPESNLLNHMDAHIQQHLKGDMSEDHLAHAAWNLLTLMWMQENRPELMDLSAPDTNSVRPSPLHKG